MKTFLKTISEKAALGIFIFTLAIIPSFFKTQSAKAGVIDTVLAKDTSNLPAVLDLETRKKILNKVFETTQSEINGLEKKLNDLNLSDNLEKINESFLNDLSGFKSYNKSLSEKANSDEISLEEIKSMAKEIKDWRETTYTPKLKEITNMTFIFDEENLLKIAQERIEKISGDIKKLSRQNYINTEKLKTLLSKAEKALQAAKDNQNEAKNLFLKSFESLVKTEKNASSTEQQEIISTMSIIAEQPKEAVSEVEEETPAEIQESVRNSLKDSLKNIKGTYDIFFQMNSEIKKYL